MPGKCCCAPDINAAKGDILRALNSSLNPVPASIPPPGIEFAIDAIVRRIADLLYKPPSTFEADVLRQLASIIAFLNTLKADQADKELLLLIARNTNDLISQAAANQRITSLAIANTATQAQAKDLLFATTDSRRDLTRQIRQLADGIATRFAAIGGAIIALTVATAASKVAILTAIAASLARVLTAIAAIKFPQPQKVDLSSIERDLSDLVRSKLTLDPFVLSVPSCQIGEGMIPTLTYSQVPSFAIKNRLGQSTKDGIIAPSQMVSSLLVSGQLSCAASESLSSEEILFISSGGADGGVYTAFPATLSAYWFTLQLEDVDDGMIRTYKLAGFDSEYGAGNWSILDGSGSACKSFTHIYLSSARLDVPVRGDVWGIRVSPKPGVSFRVTAHGRPFS